MFHGDDAMKNIGMVHKGGIGQGKGGIDQCKGVLNMGFSLCLERRKTREKRCSIEAEHEQQAEGY